MFNRISRHYDLLNHLLSLNIDRYWRRRALKYLQITPKVHRILDLACGSGDVAKLLEEKYSTLKIFGLDFSINMLKIARKKLKRTKLILADIYNAPFKNRVFDRIIVAFGFRNFPDKGKALRELYNLLNENGILCILELGSRDRNRIFAFIFDFYFKKILPVIGGIISKEYSAYKYLPASVYNFPGEKTLRELILSSSFKNVEFYRMSFGLCNAIVCFK
jgi:demethylmenaquinone methyltransferase/2-methoxy-6-polyprenyl-1,4-benzoquinol methylase